MQSYTRETLLPMALECCFGGFEVGVRMVELANRIASQAYLQARLESVGNTCSAACSNPGDPKSSPAPSAET